MIGFEGSIKLFLKEVKNILIMKFKKFCSGKTKVNMDP